ncbi:uncharacterized protein LOC141912265 [Tubulanus polymorphus]|uniref:uncharacterized protein LOC141912265 n=1 Tax=Tubulanus polymorphus TaxID=672921 RepID=UPI003DA63179
MTNFSHPPCKDCGRVEQNGKGARLIILDAGSRNGFVPGANLVFEAKNGSGDYHHQMDGDIFETWLEDQLIPALEEPSLIVMDQASYHLCLVKESQAPKSSQSKEEIKRWLEKKKVTYDQNLNKPQLVKLCQTQSPNKLYKSEQLILDSGHELLILPVKHCELNPIEMVWHQIKAYAKKKNTTNKLKDVEKLIIEGRELVTAENWRNYEDHVKKIENELWIKDKLSDNLVKNFETNHIVINLNDSDESEDERENERENQGAEDDSEKDGNMSSEGDESENEVCAVCGEKDDCGDDQLVEWVACSMCDRWFHVSCLTNHDSENFKCKRCEDILCKSMYFLEP